MKKGKTKKVWDTKQEMVPESSVIKTQTQRVVFSRWETLAPKKHAWLNSHAWDRFCTCSCGFYISGLDQTQFSCEAISAEIAAHDELKALEDNDY